MLLREAQKEGQDVNYLYQAAVAARPKSWGQVLPLEELLRAHEIDIVEESRSPEYKVALYCFIAAEKIIPVLAGEHAPKLSGNSYWTALTETVCCALHLIDRDLFEWVPDARDARMNALLNECLKLMPHGMYAFSDSSKEAVDAEAHELLLSLYAERMEEYANIGDDWLRRVLIRYGRHVTDRLQEIDFSSETVMKAEMQMTALYSGLLRFVPEFFK